jgi:predicted Zn-dependent protease
VAGLLPETVRSIKVNGLDAATARASAERWDFDVTVVRLQNRIFRFLTAVPKGNADLDRTANILKASFRTMTPAEAASLKPLRIRVLTVQPGETISTISSRMMGTDRKLDLFKLINALPAAASLSPGQKVKIISE